MNTVALIELLTFHSYRLAGYAALQWMDDPAILALVFC
jgi:hypothetical protein